MIETTEDLIDRPDVAESHGRDRDVLDEMLASLRLSGGVFLEGCFRNPWSLLSHIRPDDCARFFPVPRHVICYHFVRSGRLTCELEGCAPVEVSAGEIVLLPRNDPHFLHGTVRGRIVDASETIDVQAEDGLFHARWGGDGDATEVYCGFLGSSTPDNLLLESLPGVLTIKAVDEAGDWMVRSLDFAVHGLAHNAPEMVGKLAEGLFAEAVRRFVESMPADEQGWLAGLRDPAVGKALALIHRRYAEPWTIDDLAREAGVSRTVLTDRFRALLGEAPMHYCARWRMRTAAAMLLEDRHNACSVAYTVGFNSEAAFSRAFKREYGLPPAAWARLHRTMGQASPLAPNPA